MATTSKFVEVLCPSGRRQKVKVDPSMTVLQVLEEVCKKQGYDDAEYDLKHQRKVLSVTSMMRFLNLPNNAKLEMVTCEKARLVSNVTVALQLEDGRRLQDDFNPNVTLLDILRKLILELETELAEHDPVCIYMRNEYRGVSLLSNTSLKSIGITSGRAALRLMFKEKFPEQQEQEPNDCSKLKKDNSATSELKEPNEKKICLEDSAGQPSTSNNCFVEKQQQQQQQPRETSVSTPSAEGYAYTPLSIIGPPQKQIFPDDAKMFRSEEKYDPVPVSSVASTNEFADFKFPESSCDTSDIEAIDPHLIKTEVKLGLPCDRQALLYSSVAHVQTVTDGQEPDESFFQLTVDDLRKRLSHLKSDRQGKEEEALLTSALRQQKRIERISDFQMIPVRILLPNKFVLQGIFRPLETVGTIRNFVTDFFTEEVQNYQLFVTPPRTILKDQKLTLYDAKLFPAAVIHVSFDNYTGCPLQHKYLDNLSTAAEAERIAYSVLKRKHVGQSGTYDETHNESSANNTASSSMSANMSPNSASFADNKPQKGAPKWFKTGR